ncbi:hypothetical protein H4582DRAFT_1250066 [Lactarius indigo]|nr:hypothetical protein H4582DRAFT_1250066 [Lactarius indigo]
MSRASNAMMGLCHCAGSIAFAHIMARRFLTRAGSKSDEKSAVQQPRLFDSAGSPESFMSKTPLAVVDEPSQCPSSVHSHTHHGLHLRDPSEAPTPSLYDLLPSSPQLDHIRMFPGFLQHAFITICPPSHGIQQTSRPHRHKLRAMCCRPPVPKSRGD